MDVFALKQHLIGDYSRFARSFTSIREEDIAQVVEREYASGRFWPEPLIQINPRYSLGRTTASMAASGELHPVTAKHFPIGLYRHQEHAVAFARQAESFVVTTGTGSGKSLCFFISAQSPIRRSGASTSPSPPPGAATPHRCGCR